MKRLLFLLFFLLFPIYGYCASIVNVEYIHQAIKQKWNVDIPYSAELENPKIAANMKYLLTMIDRANARLNGFETTTYGDNATYATLAAADTIAVDAAVQDLIKAVEIDYPFSFTSNSSSTTFSFQISAAGTFYVDWGDGTVERYVKTDTYSQTIRHTYSDAASNYKIRLGGMATRYNSRAYSSAILFSIENKCSLKSIEGSLGEIFPYGNNLSFYRTFYKCEKLTGSIPENLFAGIQGAPTKRMFEETFLGCGGLTGSIPEDLFAGIQGAPADNMFDGIFAYCHGLTGSIPENLFAGIQGAPAFAMFSNTFVSCGGLTGSIPENLFAGIQGAPAQSMFEGTFAACYSLTSIPENLFGDIQGAAAGYMFSYTFNGCSGLTGPSARINGEYLYNIWPNYIGYMREMYSGATGLSDYSEIPAGMK